jgi:hypothetical protein
MTQHSWYDESLTRFAEVLTSALGADAVRTGVVLRDVSGRLSFFADGAIEDELRTRTEQSSRERLGAYARRDRLIALRTDAGAPGILDDASARVVEVNGTLLRYIDRRVVGADWLATPVPHHEASSRLVFSSLKGGVGRSTALSIVAAAQADLGRNVLVVDLDLEAPGVGSLLLTAERMPEFGALDHLVEQNVQRIDTGQLERFVGTSPLTAGGGLVEVCPVVGTRSRAAPQNYLSKLSRASIEALNHSGQSLSVANKMEVLLDQLESRRRYDVVLIDVRAGLAEIAAGPLLNLGASVLLFGTAQPQTIDSLRFLFAHLASLIPPQTPSPWQRLKMVHAKAQRVESHKAFNDELWELFAEHLYEEIEGLEGFNFDVEEPDAPHHPIVIPHDLAFADWDPTSEPTKLLREYYARTFEGLLAFVDDMLLRDKP